MSRAARRAPWLALALGLTLGAQGSAARAETFRHDDHRFELALGDDWQRDGDALTWRNPSTAQTLTITRIDSSNYAAWRGRRSFFTGVEQGVIDAAPGYRALRKRRGKLGRVPHLDLWFEYQPADSEPLAVAMRFVFFRRYTLVLAIDTPAERYRKQRARLRQLTKSFKPYFAPR